MQIKALIKCQFPVNKLDKAFKYNTKEKLSPTLGT